MASRNLVPKHSIRSTWLKVRCVWVQLQLLELHFQQVRALLELSESECVHEVVTAWFAAVPQLGASMACQAGGFCWF